METSNTLYQTLYKADVAANEAIGGNIGETISRQDAYGVQQRRPELNYDQAKEVAHRNMILVGIAFLIGIYLLAKDKKALGLMVLAAAAGTTGLIASDWKNGKGYSVA